MTWLVVGALCWVAIALVVLAIAKIASDADDALERAERIDRDRVEQRPEGLVVGPAEVRWPDEIWNERPR